MTGTQAATERFQAWRQGITAADLGAAMVQGGMVVAVTAVSFVWGYAEAVEQYASPLLNGFAVAPAWAQPTIFAALALVVLGLTVEQLAGGGADE
jgi:hypothetical protein